MKRYAPSVRGRRVIVIAIALAISASSAVYLASISAGFVSRVIWPKPPLLPGPFDSEPPVHGASASAGVSDGEFVRAAMLADEKWKEVAEFHRQHGRYPRPYELPWIDQRPTPRTTWLYHVDDYSGRLFRFGISTDVQTWFGPWSYTWSGVEHQMVWSIP